MTAAGRSPEPIQLRPISLDSLHQKNNEFNDYFFSFSDGYPLSGQLQKQFSATHTINTSQTSWTGQW